MDDQSPYRRLVDINTRLTALLGWADANRDPALTDKLTDITVDFTLLLGDWFQQAGKGGWSDQSTLDDDTFQQLSDINDEFLEYCDWLNEQRDVSTASRLIPITDDLTRLVAELSVKRK